MADESRDTEKEKKSQVVASLSTAFVFIVIGLPLWWHTTKVYRAALPYNEIENLPRIKTAFLSRISVVFVDSGHLPDLDSMRDQLLEKLSATADKTGEVSPKYEVFIRQATPQETATVKQLKNDNSAEDLDRLLSKHWENQNQMGHYTFVILPDNGKLEGLEPEKIYVGKHRNSILFNLKDGTQLISNIVNIVKTVYIDEEAVTKAYSAASARRKHDAESARAQKSVTGHQISFTLLNSNPEAILVEWDIKTAVQMYLEPFMAKFPHLDVSVDSQVLHYSSIKINPKREGDMHVLSDGDLPHMITPIEAKLGSYVSLHPSLNFIVYIPEQQHMPLHIRHENGQLSPSNAFLSPQWGGIMIYNIKRNSTDSQQERVALDMRAVMSRFIPQLKLLLGGKSLDLPEGMTTRRVPVNSITTWEQDAVFRLKTAEYLATTTNTLTSLAQLLGKISNMVINDNIQEQVLRALRSIHTCHDALKGGNLTKAVLTAKEAVRASENAFFDPSILELLYFPDDQKYAIYIPLFLPVCLPVLMSLLQSLKWLRGQKTKNEDKAKQD